MDYIISPKANAEVTVYFGEAPVSARRLRRGREAERRPLRQFHATDEAYFKDVWYWNTPTVTCLDGRGDICTDFDAWTKAWTEITGS